MIQPRYPIYIPTKGRSRSCLTARCLRREGTPFVLVVEPQEFDAYAAVYGGDCLLTLPFSGRGTSTPARNWIKDHATAAGHLRHWQLDDNIYRAYRLHNGGRWKVRYGLALAIAEDFVDRYENVGIAGLNYDMFVVPTRSVPPPFYLNVHVYSCSLILNTLPYRWRPKYNEDTDYCLQVLANGWCTVLINAFCVKKVQTLVMKGGNHPIYQHDGRLEMARSLERAWPGVVTVGRRFKRPQHHIAENWTKFDTPLRRKADAVIPTTPNDYGMVFKPTMT